VVPVAEAGAIAHQAASQDVLTVREHRRQRMARRQRTDQDRTDALLRKNCEGRFEIAIGSGIGDKELQAQRTGRRL
jgi:hypothetical protein